MLTNEDRKYILNQHLRTIYGISNKEYQNRVWIRGEGPECDVFDDGDPILEYYQDFSISASQYQILKNFRDKFRMFSDNNNWPHKFIDTPEWNEITEMAKEVL